jgi:ribosomal protein L11 methyltransferase
VIRLAVRVSRDQAEEALAELLELAPAGVEEVQIDDHRVEYAVYGPPGELPSLPDLQALAGDTPIEVSTSEIADDWHERWKDFHKPVLVTPPSRVGPARSRDAPEIPSLLIRPPWEPPPQGDGEPPVELVIDPGQAFGTGGHASTRLCLGLLLELAGKDHRRGAVLDVGTGSGVLAIAAAKLGFSPLLGLDNERESIAAAAANARANAVVLQTERFDLRSDALPWLGAQARSSDPHAAETLVLANLLRPLLIDLAGAIERAPAALIAGGLLNAELDDVAATFRERHDLRECRRRSEGEWGALLLVSPAASATAAASGSS